MATPIGYRLSLEVFSFVVEVVTQAIEEGESLAGDRDGFLAPNSILQRALPLTIGLIGTWQGLTIRLGILLLSA
jgi:hypothetical protein